MRDPRMLAIAPILLGAVMLFGSMGTRSAPVTPEQQQLLAAAQLADEDAVRSRALREAINEGELSPVDRALLEQQIKKIRPDGSPEPTLWSAGSVAMAVGGFILMIGGFLSALLWRRASEPDAPAPSA